MTAYRALFLHPPEAKPVARRGVAWARAALAAHRPPDLESIRRHRRFIDGLANSTRNNQGATR